MTQEALDLMLTAVTPEALAVALEGFATPLSPDRDMDWLALAVRRSLAISMPNISDGPERTSNAAIQAELERLAALAGATWLELFQCDDAADSRLWEYAWHLCDRESRDYHRFQAAVAELDWLAGFMRQAAKATTSQRGPWRQSERKRLRVERGQHLAPIFEAAFGKTVSANNYPNDARHTAPTPFMDFYSRMVTLAFGPGETSNLAEVVKAACQLHRQHPAKFPKEIIPDLWWGAIPPRLRREDPH